MMNYKNCYPWITEALCTKIKNKNSLHSIAISSQDDNIIDEYKENTAFYSKKFSYFIFGDQLEINKGDLSKIWKVLRDILGLHG